MAAALGWMPLEATNVPAFHKAHPSYDGRGVLIAILDGGVDPTVPGLTQLPGDRGVKLLDVRDFSGEGRVPLFPAEVTGAAVRLPGGVTLAAGSLLRALHRGGPVYGGFLDEARLGEAPAADLNGNGRVGDSLAVVVIRTGEGWAVLADTDGDGSLAGEHPIRDYLVGRQSFGWRTGSNPPPTGVAVNLRDRGAEQAPELDLVFDTGAHGTHVAGIAAGHAMYGVQGFDGVAPGAELLGIKFANNARGGITVTGSMVRALDYAIRFARARQQPLVVNMSFGVGNEAEGAARIDAVVDSILALHPDVVLTASAGNDGPGFSTIGFPASARRVLNVGASYPGVFLPPRPGGGRSEDLVAFFSARGGELAGPDLIAPGVAYSTVPRFDTGEEVKHGTSMAAPHVAGLAARLLSGLTAEGRTVSAETVRRALMASGRALPGGTFLDQGAGQPDLLRAWDLLRHTPEPRLEVQAVGHGVSAAMHWGGLRDTVQLFHLQRHHGALETQASFVLRSTAPWLVPDVSSPVSVRDTTSIAIRLDPRGIGQPGVHVGVIEGWGADSVLGPAFRLVQTVAVPRPARRAPDTMVVRLEPGRWWRTVLAVDSEHPFRVAITERRGVPVLAFLHEPGGMPWRGGHVIAVGGEDTTAAFEADARDVQGGWYELVLVGGPAAVAEPVVVFEPAPVSFHLAVEGTGLRVQVVEDDGGPPVTLDTEIAGMEREIEVVSHGAEALQVPFDLPPWVAGIVVDVEMDRDLWPQFTDFGVTLLDGGGFQLTTDPMNYRFGRLEYSRAEAEPQPASVALLLTPGWADPEATAEWRARLTIRLYPDEPVPVGRSEGAALVRGAVHPLPQMSWSGPEGFALLARGVLHRSGRAWSREVRLVERR
jgi:subtilisin family serine protease